MLSLTKNDNEIIGYLERDSGTSCTPFIRKVLTILSVVHRGLHHLPYGTINQIPIHLEDFIEYKFQGVLATTDYDTLTRLVFAAHELGVRVELQSTRKNCIIIQFHERTHAQDKEFDNSRHHPTLDQAFTWFKKNWVEGKNE